MSSKDVRLSVTHVSSDTEVVVRVYRSHKRMLRAARRYDPQLTCGYETNAVCQGRQMGGLLTGRRVIIRLCRDRLDLEVVAHEVSHAALAIYGASTQYEPAGQMFSINNETLAYIYSGMLAAIVKQLTKRKLMH